MTDSHDDLIGPVLDAIRDACDLLDREAVTGEAPGRDPVWRALLASGAVAHIEDRSRPGERLVPGFQLTGDRTAVTLEAIAVNAELGTPEATITAVSWWVTPHAQLGGVSPSDLLGQPNFPSTLEWAKRDTNGIDN